MTDTEIQLLVTHRAAVLPLDEISEKYFGLCAAEARRRAAMNKLPIATFRLVDSQKAPLMVRVADLALVIDARAEQAWQEHEKSQI